MIKDQIINILEDITGIKNPQVEFPENEAFGDYSSNVAMQIAQKGEKGGFLENIEWILTNVNEKNWKIKKFNLPVGRLNSEVVKIIKAKSDLVYLNGFIYAKINGWLGHRVGHKEVLDILRALPFIIFYPIEVYKDRGNELRNLFAFDLGKFGVAVIEVLEEKDRNEIVTIFFVNPRRLKNGILGKYRIPSLQAPVKAAGASFSGLQESQLFYSKLGKKSQDFSLDYEIKRNSYEFAEEIVEKLNSLPDLPATAEAKAGFINFRLKKDVLVDNLIQIGERKQEYGKSSVLEGKRINFEFGQPNTHKLPHIGHLYSYILGHSLTNILGFAGANLYRVNYQGDIGPHVAKCLWAYKKENPKIPEDLEGRVQVLQKMYQEGSKAYDEDQAVKNEIDKLNRMIYSEDESVMDLYRETRSWSVDYYKQFEKRLGITFDRYYFESEVHELGKKGVEEAVGRIFRKSESAIIFEGSKYGLHDRVFITKYATPTYEAKDTYLEQLKYKEWPYDLMIITTANEQNEYFKVVFKAIEELAPELRGKLMHIGFGMVNLTTGKMSSREGQIVSAVDLVEMVKKGVAKINKDENISETVALGAIKYAFLRSNPLQDMKFNIKESISLEGNSGPYLQYTIARTNSVLARAEFQGVTLRLQGYTLQCEETAILRKLSQFQEVIVSAAKTYSPNILCNYLYDLASKFNTFYNKYRILATPSKVESFRIKLTAAVGRTLKTGLTLLGIQAPEKM